MYLSPRTALVRNLGVSITNGSITLILLLIAPLGLAAVIANTLLVALASFGSATFADRLVLYLQGESQRAALENQRADLDRRPPHDLDR